MHTLNIILHVASGSLAILIGIGAYLTYQNRAKHRLWGRLFLYAIGVSLAGAFAGVIFFVDRPFLTVVSLQATYMTLSGWRSVRRRGRPPTRLDFGLALLTFGAATFFWMRLNAGNQVWHPVAVNYLLGYLGIVLLFDVARQTRFFGWLDRKPRFWLYDHVFRMTSAFSACVAAGMGSLLSDWEPWNQLAPAGLTTVWLVLALLWFPRRVLAVR